MQIWNEKGEAVDIGVLKDGLLMRVTFDTVDLDITHGNPLWIYRGWAYDPDSLLFDTPGGLANRRGYCYQKREKVAVENVKLVEIVAREPHAVLAIFNAWGTAKSECDGLKQAISNATAHLTGV